MFSGNTYSGMIGSLLSKLVILASDQEKSEANEAKANAKPKPYVSSTQSMRELLLYRKVYFAGVPIWLTETTSLLRAEDYERLAKDLVTHKQRDYYEFKGSRADAIKVCAELRRIVKSFRNPMLQHEIAFNLHKATVATKLAEDRLDLGQPHLGEKSAVPRSLFRITYETDTDSSSPTPSPEPSVDSEKENASPNAEQLQEMHHTKLGI